MNNKLNLLNRFTFEHFVVGPNNSLAHSICMAVSESLGHTYNPLFLYSPVGLGKTHLVQSVAHVVQSQNPDLRVIYSPCEQFAENLILAIQNKQVDEFRRHYRSCDLLIIDDIHFILGKEHTQEEFFHTFNALFDRPSQIILTSDRPPKQLEGIENRLISRFEWGILADIQKPDYEVRLAILKKKAAFYEQEFDSRLLVELAQNLSGSIRELEGCLLKLVALQTIKKKKLTLDVLGEVLSETQAHIQTVVSVDTLIQTVCEHYSVCISDLLSKKRQHYLVHARQVGIYLARTLLDIPFQEIGEHFGRRDHTTALHAFNKIEQKLQKDSLFQNEINHLVHQARQSTLA